MKCILAYKWTCKDLAVLAAVRPLCAAMISRNARVLQDHLPRLFEGKIAAPVSVLELDSVGAVCVVLCVSVLELDSVGAVCVVLCVSVLELDSVGAPTESVLCCVRAPHDCFQYSRCVK